MRYPVYNFDIYQGADEFIPIAFYHDNEGKRNPYTITANSFLMTVKVDKSSEILDQLSSDKTADGRIKIGIINENVFEEKTEAPFAIQVFFPHEVTSSFQYPTLVYDLFKIDKNGIREIMLHGKITVEKSVSYGDN